MARLKANYSKILKCGRSYSRAFISDLDVVKFVEANFGVSTMASTNKQMGTRSRVD